MKVDKITDATNKKKKSNEKATVDDHVGLNKKIEKLNKDFVKLKDDKVDLISKIVDSPEWKQLESFKTHWENEFKEMEEEEAPKEEAVEEEAPVEKTDKFFQKTREEEEKSLKTNKLIMKKGDGPIQQLSFHTLPVQWSTEIEKKIQNYNKKYEELKKRYEFQRIKFHLSPNKLSS